MSADAHFAIDSGTTNSRVWVVRGDEVLASSRAAAGVRDTARTGSARFLRQGIARALDEACELSGLSERPRLAMAAGMITSELGLVELPHLQAPVGWRDLAGAVERVEFPEFGGLAVCFVPGVRSGEREVTAENAAGVDIIRGEETELFGALEMLGIGGPLLYVHLGSHTKAIRVDAEGRIAGGVTTLTGEMAHALRTGTILAGCLAERPGGELDEKALARGAALASRHGLSRALFLLRILSRSGATEAVIESMFAGALASEDVRAMCSAGLLGGAGSAVLSGLPELQPAWRHFLEAEGLAVTPLSADETERAFLTGLSKIVAASGKFR